MDILEKTVYGNALINVTAVTNLLVFVIWDVIRDIKGHTVQKVINHKASNYSGKTLS